MDKFRVLSIDTEPLYTKAGVFENENEIIRVAVSHAPEKLKEAGNYIAQADFRAMELKMCLADHNVSMEGLSAIVCRGGPFPPIPGGAHRINNALLKLLSTGSIPDHPTNAAAPVGHILAENTNIPVMIYDGISTNELGPLAKITGIPQIERESMGHTLNMKAAARKAAAMNQIDYQKANIIVAYLRSGNVVSLHSHGKMTDLVPDDEGAFSTERAGRIPTHALIGLCFNGQLDRKTINDMFKGNGGVAAHLGTKDVEEVEKRRAQGCEKAALICAAMAYQTAKAIGELATVVCGNVDRIVLIGPMARWDYITDEIIRRVSFIAPVDILPEEDILLSLASGGQRVLAGKEPLKEFPL
jgi:butyrate kinase